MCGDVRGVCRRDSWAGMRGRCAGDAREKGGPCKFLYGCAGDIRRMCGGCAGDVRGMCGGCAGDVRGMCGGCAEDVRGVCRGNTWAGMRGRCAGDAQEKGRPCKFPYRPRPTLLHLLLFEICSISCILPIVLNVQCLFRAQVLREPRSKKSLPQWHLPCQPLPAQGTWARVLQTAYYYI